MSQIFEFARFTATEFQLLRRVSQLLLRSAVRDVLKVATLKGTHADSDFSNSRLRPVTTQFMFLYWTIPYYKCSHAQNVQTSFCP
jgi:hypothetical protein